MITTNIKIKNQPYFHPNTSLEFTSEGMRMRVSINIPYCLIKFLPSMNISKGKEMFTYSLSQEIKSGSIKKDKVQSIHNFLIRNCMIAIRIAKKRQLDWEIDNIKHKQSFVS